MYQIYFALLRNCLLVLECYLKFLIWSSTWTNLRVDCKALLYTWACVDDPQFTSEKQIFAYIKNLTIPVINVCHWCGTSFNIIIMERKLKQWWSTIHQYQQNEQPPLTSNHWKKNKKTPKLWFWIGTGRKKLLGSTG